MSGRSRGSRRRVAGARALPAKAEESVAMPVEFRKSQSFGHSVGDKGAAGEMVNGDVAVLCAGACVPVLESYVFGSFSLLAVSDM